MRVLPFTIPASFNQSLVVKEEVLPYFYTHFHRHEEVQLTWVQEGNGTLVVGNNMHSFKSNEIYFLGPNMPHVFKNDPSYFASGSTKKICTTTIFFNPKGKMAPVLELPELREIHNFLLRYKEGFKVPQEYCQEVAVHITRIKESAGVDQLVHFFQLLSSLKAIKKLEALTNAMEVQSVSDIDGIRIGQIYNYILQYFDKNITLNDITAVAHMTREAFCRYFKKHTGHTFVSFLNEVRINEACKNLAGGKFDSIGSVAYQCGFNSVTHFNRIFKNVKGQSPKEYLERLKNNVGDFSN